MKIFQQFLLVLRYTTSASIVKKRRQFICHMVRSGNADFLKADFWGVNEISFIHMIG
jgi:hypothetical protein